MGDPRNQGHGHVVPRPDGAKARCGGPAMCRVCQAERAALETAPKQAQETSLPPQGASSHAWRNPLNRSAWVDAVAVASFAPMTGKVVLDARVVLEANSLLSASPAPAPQEPARPDILEKLTYHKHERDDLTLDECLEVLASGYRKVHGRTDRQMVMQILALLAASPAPGALGAVDAEAEDAAPASVSGYGALAAMDLLRRIEPHIDAIVCYASTCDEHEPNLIAKDLRTLLHSYPHVPAFAWRPIETAQWQERALLYAPPENLYEKPQGRPGEFRVARRADWTWATHWMPLPQPPQQAPSESSAQGSGGEKV